MGGRCVAGGIIHDTGRVVEVTEAPRIRSMQHLSVVSLEVALPQVPLEGGRPHGCTSLHVSCRQGSRAACALGSRRS